MTTNEGVLSILCWLDGFCDARYRLIKIELFRCALIFLGMTNLSLNDVFGNIFIERGEKNVQIDVKTFKKREKRPIRCTYETSIYRAHRKFNIELIFFLLRFVCFLCQFLEVFFVFSLSVRLFIISSFRAISKHEKNWFSSRITNRMGLFALINWSIILSHIY